jgi:hypothetical protein
MNLLRAFSFVLLLTLFAGHSAPAIALQDQPAGVTPVAIRIPTAVVDTTIEPLQITDGAPQTPGSTWAVGWYEQLGTLADSENTVFYGLPDYYRVGPAVFWFLPNLVAGDSIEVTGNDGLIYPYIVDSATTYDRATAPLGEIFGQTGEEMLTIFTAAPPYDSEGNYVSLVVVRGVPSGEPFAPLESSAADVTSDLCVLAPHTLQMNGQSLAPVEVGETAREQLDLSGAIPASDEIIASIQSSLQSATGCPIVIREALALTDGRVLTLVGPPGSIPLDELVSPGGFDSLGTAPEAKVLAYVVFSPTGDGWSAEGVPSFSEV